MAEADLSRIASALYALPPEDFTAARDAAARQSADRSTRTAVKALRRPTVSAWVVNRLARERAELLEQLLGLGSALAEAQAAGSGDDLRALGRQRRELVQGVVGAATDTVGRELPAGVRSEVEQTLEAALADPAAADAVRSGALVRPLSFAGFGGVDLSDAVGAPTAARPYTAPAQATRAAQASDAAPVARDEDAPAGGATGNDKNKDKDKDKRTGDARRKRASASSARRVKALAAAEKAALDAAAALDDAVRGCEKAQRRHQSALAGQERAEADLGAAEQSVADLERRLGDARERAQQAGHAAHDARDDAARAGAAGERAVRRVAEAQDVADAARGALDALRRG
ncbi:MAG TPA: hypothetical protein VM433_06790 [Mycobacteriales bacterium]|nr:hypothetical protein [Mycobacteriales bacterium]